MTGPTNTDVKLIQGAGSPMDFIRKNLEAKNLQPSPDQRMQQISDVEAAKPPTPPVTDSNGQHSQPLAPFTERVKSLLPQQPSEPAPAPATPEPNISDLSFFSDDQTKQPEEQPETPEEETDDLEEDIKNPAAENFKKVRTKLKETQKQARELQERLEQTDQELTRYKSGEAFPDQLQEKNNRIAQLEVYEKIHSLKTSPAYQEKFVQPAANIKTKLKEIAADYQIPPAVIEKALNTENRADLNRFISQHFDDVGGLEVKNLVTQLKEIESGAKEAEKEPEQALQRLEIDYRHAQEQRIAKRHSLFNEVGKGAFEKALIKAKEEGVAHELILKENDPEHNKKYVEPVQTKAAQEYGKLVVALAQHGLENLPDDLAYGLARMVQLAVASGIAIQTRAAAEKHAQDIQASSRRSQGIYRPNIGGGNGHPAQAAPTKVPIENLGAEAIRRAEAQKRR